MPPDRHIPFKKSGWGPAIATVLAAVGFWTAAWTIHHNTFREPTDLMMRQVGEEPVRTAAENAAPVPNAAARGGTAPGTRSSETKGTP